MDEHQIASSVDGSAIALAVDGLKAVGERRSTTQRLRERCASEFAAQACGAAVGACILAVGASESHWRSFVEALAIYVLVGATVGRRSRWSAMLPFTSILGDLLSRLLAGSLVWLLMDSTAGAHVSDGAILLAAIAATSATTLVRRLGSAPRTRIAVIGGAAAADQLRLELRAAKLATYEVVGVVGPGPIASASGEGAGPTLGAIGELDGVIERNDIDILLIEGGATRPDVFEHLANTCLHTDVDACELTQFYEDTFGHVPVTEIDSAWFRYIMHPRFRSPDTVAKRAVDLTVAVLAGLTFAPVLGLCALLIKLHDGGPVLFRQRRIGSGGREFTLLKLRTMRVAPAEVRWSSVDDDRITAVGRLLRRTHLDEVPQLINVLRGQMSIVGPRPEQPAFVARLERTLPHYSRRHLIKPGLTGWAQVRCGYAGSDTGSAWKLCHDLFYLKHQSLWLDLAILAETARTLVADRQFPTRDGGALVVVAPRDDGGALLAHAVAAD